jgi:hypothetical protein
MKEKAEEENKQKIKDDISLYSKLEVHLHTYVVNLCCRLCHELSPQYSNIESRTPLLLLL